MNIAVIVVISALIIFIAITVFRAMGNKKKYSSNTAVYVNEDPSSEKIYHKSKDAHNMEEKSIAIEEQKAIENGYTKCDKCYK